MLNDVKGIMKQPVALHIVYTRVCQPFLWAMKKL